MGRENDLYRDKIEVSLDGRQIFSLFFAGAVIICTVFVIGVMVGKRVEARAHVDRGVAAAGDPLAALDRLESESPLSFRRALRGGEAAGGAVDAEIAALASAQRAAEGAAEPQAQPAGAGKAGDAADAKVSKDAGNPADGKAEKAKAEKDAKEAKAEKDAKDAKAEKAAKAEKDAKAAKDAKVSSEASLADEESDKDAKVDSKAKDKDKDKKSRYTLQLSSFQERSEAEAFQVELRAAGYTPFVVPAEVDGKGTFYRVRLGTYPSYEDAVKAKAEFERKVSRIAYVTKI